MKTWGGIQLQLIPHLQERHESGHADWRRCWQGTKMARIRWRIKTALLSTRAFPLWQTATDTVGFKWNQNAYHDHPAAHTGHITGSNMTAACPRAAHCRGVRLPFGSRRCTLHASMSTRLVTDDSAKAVSAGYEESAKTDDRESDKWLTIGKPSETECRVFCANV